MAPINNKRFTSFSGILIVVLILISESECKGRSSGGGRSSSHSSSSHGSGSHSSYGGGSHTSYGSGSHSSYGGSSHSSYGGETHSYGSSSGHYSSGGSKPIGFDHVNNQAHNSLSGGRTGIGFDHVNSQVGYRPPPVYHPYKPQTVVHPGGYVNYHPPTQLQYTPPVSSVHYTSTHYVPVYHPTVIHSQSSSSDSVVSHGSSFLSGYLIGRLSSSGHSHEHSYHVTNNYHNSDSTGSSGYYTVHHYHQNPDKVPSKFSVPGEDLTECQEHVTDQLCVPNTNAFCLRNGTIMCTTPTIFTTACEANSTARCVYSRIECKEGLGCNATANQTYIDFYLPCIANVTYLDNRVLDYDPDSYLDSYLNRKDSYELCVTAIAHPRKLESPFGAVVNFLTELGKWHLEELADIHNLTTPTNNTLI